MVRQIAINYEQMFYGIVPLNHRICEHIVVKQRNCVSIFYTRYSMVSSLQNQAPILFLPFLQKTILWLSKVRLDYVYLSRDPCTTKFLKCCWLGTIKNKPTTSIKRHLISDYFQAQKV